MGKETEKEPVTRTKLVRFTEDWLPWVGILFIFVFFIIPDWLMS